MAIEFSVQDNSVGFSVGSAGARMEKDHDKLINRDLADQHPISAISGLQTALDGKADYNDLAAEIDRAAQAEEDLQTQINGKADSADLTAEVERATAAEQGLSGDISSVQGDIEDIQSLIPAQATSSNKLADKAFVNSSIGTNTANYISDNGQPFASLAALQAYTGTVTNNDYAFVTGTDEDGNTYFDRYKATVTTTVSWSKEYRLNNSSFTAEQWAAITSGITSGLVALIGTAIQPTDYATKEKAGLVRASTTLVVNPNNGVLTAETRSYAQYLAGYNDNFIGKGTLENLIAAGHIASEAYVNNATQSVTADEVDVAEETWTFTLDDDTTVTKRVMLWS